MSDLDPLWLRSFVAIAETGSVTRAAQNVHRTQSAVSMHLKQLETSLATRLVERSTRSLALTAEGERFMPHARKLLSWQDETRAAMRAGDTPLVQRVGISEYFLPSRLAELLKLLHDTTPGARFELLWSSSATLQQLWQVNEMDLAILTSDRPLPQARLLRREPLYWVSNGQLALPHRSSTPLVLLGPDCPVRQMALTALARAGREHHIQLSCAGAHGAMAAIRAGWGVGCLNQSAIPADLQALTAPQIRHWPAAGRLSFYALARPSLQAAERALRQWAAS